MNPYIMLAVAIVLLIGAILRQVDWKKLAIKWVGNNPAHAQIYIKAGDTVGTVEGERDKNNDLVYHYKLGKIKKDITLKPNYPYEYIRGRRIIGIEDGFPVGSPLGYMSAELSKKYIESGPELSVLLNGTAVVKALQSISQSKPFNWSLILIIGIAVIVGVYWFNNYGPGVSPTSKPGVTAPAAQNTTQQKDYYLVPVKTVTP